MPLTKLEDRLRAGVQRYNLDVRSGTFDLLNRSLGDIDELRGACLMLMERQAEDWLFWLHFSKPLGSPIEATMYLAMALYWDRAQGTGLEEASWLQHRCGEKGPKHAPPPEGAPDDWRSLGICCQHTLGRYRLDFLLTAHVGAAVKSYVAVEVDGHDFHERTKEQAKHDRQKDRAIQAAGMKILRFTGSEVYADPLKCAKEAVDAAFGADVSAWRANL